MIVLKSKATNRLQSICSRRVIKNYLSGSRCFRGLWVALVAFVWGNHLLAANLDSFESTIQQALRNDIEYQQSLAAEKSFRARATAESTLPDPSVSLSVMNLPTDSFDHSQEPMTQIQLGYSQSFLAGDTLSLRELYWQKNSEQQPWMREDNRAKIIMGVGHLWLEAMKTQKTLDVILQNRQLFEQLVDVSQARYASSIGKTQQQDLIRAQLELTRLDDRLVMLSNQRELVLSELSYFTQRIGVEDFDESSSDSVIEEVTLLDSANEFPAIVLHTNHKKWQPNRDEESMVSMFMTHPSLKRIDLEIEKRSVEMAIEKEQTKPGWRLNASYGFRDESATGMPRSDFVSIGFSMDLPLFTENRQDKKVQAAAANHHQEKLKRWQHLRRLVSQYRQHHQRLQLINQRLALFDQQLLPQMSQQAEASLTAYTNDEGDFSDVVRARIAELNTEIERIELTAEQLKTILSLNYFAASKAEDVIPTMTIMGVSQ